jgi:hypothetical protein
MLIQSSKCIVFAITKIAFEARAIPRSIGGDVLRAKVWVSEQLVRQHATRISLTDSLEDRAVIDIHSPLA